MKVIICHYGEIALKGKNRPFFEKKLVTNIRFAIGNDFLVKRISGRIIIELPEDIKKKKIKEIKRKLKKVIGIVYFFEGEKTSQGIKDIEKASLDIISKKIKKKKIYTFKIQTKRNNKQFSPNSQKLNEFIGDFLLSKFPNKLKVKMKSPDIIVRIEIVEKSAFIYSKKIKGVGGLPVGVSGKAISLISGGIDSPVASFLAMKRGLEVIFVHFHSYPLTDKSSIEKLKKIIVILSEFQPKTKIYLVPIAEWQKKVFNESPEKLRIVLLRRIMVRIAERIAEKEMAKAIVSGENLGQVASQTIENIQVIASASKMLILRPLIGFDKLGIIKLAKKIKTYATSILPYQDSCSKFLPKYPETKSKIKEIIKIEKELSVSKLYKRITSQIEIIRLN